MPRTEGEKSMPQRDLFEAHFEPYEYRVDHTVDCRRYQIEYGSLVTPAGETPYTIARMRSFVCVLAVVPGTDGDEPRVALVLQYRYAPDCWQLELPAGGIEAGETPLEAAERELREECGLVPDEVVDLGVVWPSAGSLDEGAYLVAMRCKAERLPLELDPGEQLEVLFATRSELEEVLANGRFGQAAGYVAWMRAQARGLIDAWL